MRQTQKNFEWLVVDDGSTDGTEKYFNNLLKNKQQFIVRYIKQNNGGKHRAVNEGVSNAQGTLFFIVDSDDYLADNAIEKICKWANSLDDSHKWAGIAGLKGYSLESVIGGKGGKSFIDAKNNERKKYHLAGDKAEVYFTHVLRKYPFPEFENEKFITEDVVWNEIACDGYYLRWFPEIIYIAEYQKDGLTKNIHEMNKRNPRGLLFWAKRQIKAFPYDYVEQMLAIVCYHIAVKDKYSNKVIAQQLEITMIYLYIAIVASKISALLRLKH